MEPDSSGSDRPHATRRTARNQPSDADEASGGDSDSGGLMDRLVSPSVAATGSATFITVLIIAGLLWAGTGINNGIEAPAMVTIPTPWFAALIGAGVLTVILAFMAFTFAYSIATGEASDTDNDSGDGPPIEQRGRHGSGDDNDEEGRKSRQAGRPNPGIVDVGGEGGPDGPAGIDDPAVRRRVDDNYPDRLAHDQHE